MIYLSLVQYVLHKFLTDICVVSCIRKFFLEKNLFIPLGSSSKLYHETDCHRFDEYKHIVESLKDRNSTQGTTKNIPLAFFQEHSHPFIEIPAVAAIIH